MVMKNQLKRRVLHWYCDWIKIRWNTHKNLWFVVTEFLFSGNGIAKNVFIGMAIVMDMAKTSCLSMQCTHKPDVAVRSNLLIRLTERSAHLRRNVIKLNHVWWIFYASPPHRQSVENAIADGVYAYMRRVVRKVSLRVRKFKQQKRQSSCGAWAGHACDAIEISGSLVRCTKPNSFNILINKCIAESRTMDWTMAMKRLALNSNKLNVRSWLNILFMCVYEYVHRNDNVVAVINKKYYFSITYY